VPDSATHLRRGRFESRFKRRGGRTRRPTKKITNGWQFWQRPGNLVEMATTALDTLEKLAKVQLRETMLSLAATRNGEKE
jgi:hypothetical protein